MSPEYSNIKMIWIFSLLNTIILTWNAGSQHLDYYSKKIKLNVLLEDSVDHFSYEILFSFLFSITNINIVRTYLKSFLVSFCLKSRILQTFKNMNKEFVLWDIFIV